MTRQEASAQIGQREFTIGEILKLSAGVFFENIGKWLLLSLIVYLPTGFVLQLVAMNLPLEDLMNAAVAGETAALAHMDWTPYLIYYGMQIGMSLIWVLVNLATAIYTDRWLQASRPAYSFGETFLGAIRRWPGGMVTAAVLFLCVVLLVTMMMFVAVTALPLIMILMVGFIMLLMAVYYISLSVTALPGERWEQCLPVCRGRCPPQNWQDGRSCSPDDANQHGAQLCFERSEFFLWTPGRKYLDIQSDQRAGKRDRQSSDGFYGNWSNGLFYQSGTAGTAGFCLWTASGRILMYKNFRLMHTECRNGGFSIWSRIRKKICRIGGSCRSWNG